MLLRASVQQVQIIYPVNNNIELELGGVVKLEKLANHRFILMNGTPRLFELSRVHPDYDDVATNKIKSTYCATLQGPF